MPNKTFLKLIKTIHEGKINYCEEGLIIITFGHLVLQMSNTQVYKTKLMASPLQPLLSVLKLDETLFPVLNVLHQKRQSQLYMTLCIP